jgi:hypothetical protein
VKKILKKFRDITGSEFRCDKISGKRFITLNEHTEFIKKGGCNGLIDALAVI